MASATVTSKGQITVPVAVRSRMGIRTGDRVEFVLNQNGHFEMIPAKISIQALKGIVSKPEKPVTIEEMNEAIAEQGASAG